MPLIFYPDDTQKETLSLAERIELLLDAAERYKAVMLDSYKIPKTGESETEANKVASPRDLTVAFNWEEIARVLRGIRELPEGEKEVKLEKAELLTSLAEVYEVLRSAKLMKLEAVRLALISEANNLRGGIQGT